MLSHLAVLLYSLTLCSGIAVLALAFDQAMRTRRRHLWQFLAFQLSYSLLLALLILGIYARANMGASKSWVAIYYIASVLLSVAFLTLTLPPFFHGLIYALFNPGFPELALSAWQRWIARAGAALGLLGLALVIASPRLVSVGMALAFGGFLASLAEVAVDFWRQSASSPRRRMSRAGFAFCFAFVGTGVAVDYLFQRSQILRGAWPLGVFFIPLMYLLWNIFVLRYLYRVLVPRLAAQGPALDFARFGLTARESEIVERVAEGLSNKEIAARLDIAENTVRNHLYAIFQKTGAKSRVDLLNQLRGL
jgi:DNA-binding CsgD family transcriptional regulator